ncbi:DNA sulfur modification protein DndB [Brevibacillus brevis]|uniref:DNA sulfur modification protein DndB n=1 Tax=Brevibacillus brevis TaxID=1393 RepID=UPI0007D8C83F|nr:DNA sulfur modification protein DndB [Brevibacillus brevis]
MNSQGIKANHPSIGTPTGSLLLPALMYKSGQRTWYAITIPFKTLGKFIQTSAVKKKNQVIIKKEIKNRFLDKAHKDDIKMYLQEEERFTLPPITLVSYEQLIFRPYEFDNQDNGTIEEQLERFGSVAGIVVLPIDYEFECLDGNHRTVAIRELASENPEVIDGSNMLLNIVFESDVKKIRQDFVDVNKNAKQTTPSINTLFNTRDPLAGLVSDVLDNIAYLEETTELLATSVSKNSKDIYTINNIKNAVIELASFNSQSSGDEKLSKELKDNPTIRDKYIELSNMFFNMLKENEYINECLTNRDKTPEIRNQTVLTSGTGLIVASRIAGYIFKEFERDRYKTELQKLIQLDWSRDSNLFKGKMILDGKILNSRDAISKTFESVKEVLGYEEDLIDWNDEEEVNE